MIQSCYFCVQDVKKLWFWMCLRQVSMLCHFWPFLRCVPVVFHSPVRILAHGLLELSPSLRLPFISENTSLLCIFVSPPTFPLHKLLTRLFSLIRARAFSQKQKSSFWNIIHIGLSVFWSSGFVWNTGFEVQSSGQFREWFQTNDKLSSNSD